MSPPIPQPERDLEPVLRAVLDLERSWWSRAEITKDRAVRERLGLSPARYHQLLDRAIDRPEALVYDPMLVRRLCRLRDERRRARSIHRLGLRGSAG
jgi:hypothetical protein